MKGMLYSMVKRTFDIIVAAVGLLLCLPFFVLTAVAIKIDSSGPVFYRGVRAGRLGKSFRIFKFRTMLPDMEKSGGDTTALNDPRITRIGSFLRKYKIDEMRQLINVIKGDMSIVGPRPELFAYTVQYSDEEKCILDVRPGITDLSSIRFHSLDQCVGTSNVDNIFEEHILPEKNRLRVKYVKERSFWLDIRIILLTAKVILLRILKSARTRYDGELK